jgi:predicted HTH domain antitoxin
MECEMNQVFMSEQEFSDYMDKRDEARDKEKKKELIIELYTEHLLSVEGAANKLNMTVPEFEELLKQHRKSA